MSLLWMHKMSICRAEEFAITNQRVFGTTNNTIREQAILKVWTW